MTLAVPADDLEELEERLKERGDEAAAETLHETVVAAARHMQPEDPPKAEVALERAAQNVERWGQQAPLPLVLAMAEELAELAAEISPDDAEGLTGPQYQSWKRLSEVRRTGYDVRDWLESVAEEDGEPAEDRPVLAPEGDFDVNEAREEMYDLMALCYQFDWALYQGVRGDGG